MCANIVFNGFGQPGGRRQPGLEGRKIPDDAVHQDLDSRFVLHPAVLGGQRRGDRPAPLVPEHDEQRRPQMGTGILQTAGDLRRENVAGHPHHEQFAEPRVEYPLRRHTGITTAEDRGVRPLGLRQVGQGLAPKGRPPRLAADEPLVAGDEPVQRLVRRRSGLVGSARHAQYFSRTNRRPAMVASSSYSPLSDLDGSLTFSRGASS